MALLSDLDLAGIQADADDQLFQCTGQVTRIEHSDRTVNHATAVLTTPEPAVIYSGACYIYSIPARRDRFDEVGGGLIFTRQYRVGLPSAALTVDIHLSDTFTLLTVPTGDDQHLLNRPLEVRDILGTTLAGHRRLTVQDLRQ